MRSQLNLARVKFNVSEVGVCTRPFGGEDRMDVVRSQLPTDWSAYRSKDKVYAWRHAGAAAAPGEPWQQATIRLEDDAGLFVRLLESGISRFLEGKGYEVLSRKVPALVHTGTNLLDGSLSKPCDRRVGIHPVFSVEGFLKGHDGGVDVMLLVGARTQWRVSIPVAELVTHNVDCVGLGVRLMRNGTITGADHLVGKLVGTVTRLTGQDVELSDPADPNFPRLPADVLRPEGSRQSLRRYFVGRHAALMPGIWNQVLGVDSSKSKPRELLRRVRELLKLLSGQQIPLADGLTVQVLGLLPPNAAELLLTTARMTEFVFDYASKTTDPIAVRGLRKFGPYDKANPPVKKPKFLVLCPKTFEPTAKMFFKKFGDGCTYPDRSKSYYDFPGFSKLFRLEPADFVTEFFDSNEGGSSAAAYQRAATRALGQTKDATLCFVVMREADKELAPIDDPYCVAKGILLEHGIPVSEMTIEDMRVNDSVIVHILVNVALQAYAKMGGVPFVLRAASDNKLELILGVGRADVGASRFGKKRVVGFATVFKNNGDYLVGAVRPFKNADNYADELDEVIEEGLREAIKREGITPGTPIRLIFHIYKQAGKGKEVFAVEAALKKFTDYPTEYALVHVSDTHPWIAADEDEKDGIAPRGQIVELGRWSRLINLIGPREYLQKGTPAPLKVSVDRRSTYTDIGRIAQQVYDFANVSWRGFNVARRPVTIHYAQLAAALAGKLEQTPHWKPTMLLTFLKDKKWFL